MRHSNRGMTLIEVLVAFVLLSLSLGVIFHIFAGGMRNARIAEGYSRAVFLAESKMAAVGAQYPVIVGEQQGQLDSGLRWRISIAPAQDPSAQSSDLAMRLALFDVTVQVTWTEHGKSHHVELVSVRLGSAK